jgi:hypothetical protein
MTTTTLDPQVVHDTATALAALADLDFADDQACEWCFDCPEDAPAPAEWFATTRPFPRSSCAHEHPGDWLVCGRCLQRVLQHRLHKRCSAIMRCAVDGCPGRQLTSGWVLSYRPIEQPAWSKGGGSRG